MIRRIREFNFLFLLTLSFIFFQCNQDKKTVPVAKKGRLSNPLITENTNEKQLLSEYLFFKGEMANLSPNENVYPYALNTPLFSDYAYKKRFVYLPEGSQMNYDENEVFAYDKGAILIKNFYFPKDFRDDKGAKKIVETRLLIHESTGWKALNYIWDEDQKDAQLNYIGKQTTVSWIHTDGSKITKVYNVPNNNQCKNCHIKGKDITPIGPTAAQLNRKYAALSTTMNQLSYFNKTNRLNNFPEHSDLPKFAVWDDKESGSLEARAKAYLDINCAHCHNPHGSAKNSGLDLRLSQIDLRKQGVFKPPIAAGKGSGDLQYSIVPGNPEESILLYRMKSEDPGIMMPEIGRSIVHQEGVALIEEYIKNLTIDPVH